MKQVASINKGRMKLNSYFERHPTLFEGNNRELLKICFCYKKIERKLLSEIYVLK